MLDLAVLAPDKTIKLVIDAILNRPGELGIRAISWKALQSPGGTDSFVLRSAHDFLRSSSREFSFALTVSDRMGCGREDLDRGRLEGRIEANLSANG